MLHSFKSFDEFISGVLEEIAPKPIFEVEFKKLVCNFFEMLSKDLLENLKSC